MMNATSTMNSSNIGINIHLLSFSFEEYLIKHDVQGIVMTYPETEKQEFLVKSKDVQFPNHLITLNISKDAKLIFIFFLKKYHLSKDQFIAWTVIEMSHLPQDPQCYDYNMHGTISSEVKLLNIYEYFITENEKENDSKMNLVERSLQRIKKVCGQIEVQFTMTDAFDLNEKHKHSKIPKHKSNDHFIKRKSIEFTQVCDLDQEEENSSSSFIKIISYNFFFVIVFL